MPRPVKEYSVSTKRFLMREKIQEVRKPPKVGRRKEFSDKRLVVTLVEGTRKAMEAVRGKQSMTEFAREAIAKEIQRRLTRPKPKGRR